MSLLRALRPRSSFYVSTYSSFYVYILIIFYVYPYIIGRS